ncbi:MAG: tRNA pseudouridine(38-40) synthase TruA [Pirellulales bacterium]|jgi:tRNA pseudouridine38-40 synthase
MTEVDPSSCEGPDAASPRRRIGLRLAYDGGAYSGWQAQPQQRTVQGMLAAAIATVDPTADALRGSSRTDAGVHALDQVAAFSCSRPLEPEAWLRAINANLPKDIVVVHAWQAADSFDPVGAAVRKRYRYRLYDDPVRPVFSRAHVWRQPARLNVEAMQAAAGALVGEHDYSSFETASSPRLSKVRTIYDLAVCRVDTPERANAEVQVEVEGNGFLYNMVRIIVGSLAMVGVGRKPASWMAEALAARHRPAAGPTAPPHGLTLVSIQLDASAADG